LALRERLAAGALAVGYVGHGNVDLWKGVSPGVLLDVATVRRLPDASGLGILTTATCANGFFDHPLIAESLAEAWLVEPGGGVAAWSPTATAHHGSQVAVLRRFYASLPSPAAGRGTRARTLGELTLGALRGAWQAGEANADTVLTFALLGDPSMPLEAPIRSVDRAWFPVALRPVP
jgi:hypothetical protein